ncbi:DUF2786 domain-containing protein [Methylosinus sp. PW1]|uniref:DUF2786 domain-containing protein n=1 Tax=Methylosinus sp. PW1 TaxID=107636 RepID=UPI000A06FE03
MPGGAAAARTADVERAVAHEGAHAEVRTLFEELRRRLLAARRPKSTDSEADAELARVLQRIQALRAKTVEQGCTEQEALASARKVAELLDRYGLTLGEIEMRERPCEGVGVDTGRKRRAPIDECAPTVAHFCDCKCGSRRAPPARYAYRGSASSPVLRSTGGAPDHAGFLNSPMQRTRNIARISVELTSRS